MPPYNPRGSALAKEVLERKNSLRDSIKGSDGKPPPVKHSAPEEGQFKKNLLAVGGIILAPLNLLLICSPLGIYAGMQQWGPLLVFLFNFLAIIPLAGCLGASTEALAMHTGQMLGGLLNATFGNAVEMIVTINAIRAGLITVVQDSLIGSILSNLLLVLGMAFVAGGLKAKETSFNLTGASASVTCLVLASLALTLPTVFSHVHDTTLEDGVTLSRICALILGSCYLMFLFFQLSTHAELFVGEEEENEEAEMSAWVSVLMLLAFTCLVAVNSEFLVDSIEGVSKEFGLPEAFIGTILLPIVGNAAEHTTAVSAAYKHKMDLALGVAVGSSTQIALFVVPFSVIVGWWYDVPMSLDFGIFEAAVFVLSVFIASTVLSDGQTNWFEGFMLIASYLLVAVTTWFVPKREDVRELMMLS